MTELELMIDLHRNSERQGPGSERETLKALGFVSLPDDKYLNIADIGCGSGAQTITLARNIKGQITAVDLFPEFLYELNKRAEQSGFKEKIITLQKSMDDLPFGRGEFDIIWSEGAIYNIGFERGIMKWKDFIKSGGFLAVSEITWISSTRPKKIHEFWTQEYPEIDKASNKIKVLEDNGFTLAGYFYLSENSWIGNYYEPLQATFGSFLERHSYSETAQKVVDEYKAESDLYMEYKDYYNYGFYIAKKI